MSVLGYRASRFMFWFIIYWSTPLLRERKIQMPNVQNFQKQDPPKRQAVRDLVYRTIYVNTLLHTLEEREAIINSIIDIAVEESRLTALVTDEATPCTNETNPECGCNECLDAAFS